MRRIGLTAAGPGVRLAGVLAFGFARLLALADAWDAVTVSRPYGAPRSDADALAECRRMSGAQSSIPTRSRGSRSSWARARGASRRGAA